jgi:dihydropteroate synthase
MQYGITRQRIVLDPGFGFGKTVQHNLDLLHGLGHLRALGQPLLVGTSRKSFLGHVLRRQVWDRLEGTLATVLYAVLHGAVLVRVHDVAAVAQTVRLLEALNRGSSLSLRERGQSSRSKSAMERIDTLAQRPSLDTATDVADSTG